MAEVFDFTKTGIPRKVSPLEGSQTDPICVKFFKARGLDPEDAEGGYLTPKQTSEMLKMRLDRASIYLPYRDPDGSPMIINGEVHARFRMLDGKDPKYMSRQHSGAQAYFSLNVPWIHILADVSVPLLIAEGECKALKVCVTEGWPPAIGIGGVDAYRVKVLDEAEWRGRPLGFVYDSDQESNPRVLAAQRRATAHYQNLGADVRILHISKTQHSKMKGVDDYILAGGTWEELLATATEPETNFVQELTRQWGWDSVQERLYNFSTGEYSSAEAWRKMVLPGLIEAARCKIKAAEVWALFVKHADYTVFRGLTFQPGAPSGLIEDRADGARRVNTWEEVGCTRSSSYAVDVALLLRFAGELYGAESGLGTNFLLWPMAHPEVKHNFCCIAFSAEKGIGKTTWGLIGVQAAGKWGIQVDGSHGVFTNFNHLIGQKVWVHLDEVELENIKNDGSLKSLISEDFVTIDQKYRAQVVMPNYANLNIATNNPRVARMDDDDRRYLVLRALGGARSRMRAYRRLLEAGAVQNLMWYARNQHDFGGWDPRAGAPQTEAKEMMADAAKPEWVVAARELMELIGENLPIAFQTSELVSWLIKKGHGGLADSTQWPYQNFVNEFRARGLWVKSKPVTGGAYRALFIARDNSHSISMAGTEQIRKGSELLGSPVT